MDRKDFEYLRDLPSKIIRGDIKLTLKKQTSPAMTMDGIEIENSAEIPLRMNINFNPETGLKTFNVVAVGVGPICRLDIDGTNHEPVGRSHKHSLKTARCPDLNLHDGVIAKGELSQKSLQEVFSAFCAMAKIENLGTFSAQE
jgi:hypothetical protein